MTIALDIMTTSCHYRYIAKQKADDTARTTDYLHCLSKDLTNQDYETRTQQTITH